MTATREDVDRWIHEGITRGAKYIISVCDTFSYDDYPVYVMPDQSLEQKKDHYSGSMQRINEVISLPTANDLLPKKTGE